MSADAVKVDQEFYDRILTLMRERGPSFKPLARELGCDFKTVRKAYLVGWPRLGLRPIREVLDEEVKATRAALATESLAEAAVARDTALVRADVVESRVAEARMVRAARESTITFLESLRSLTVVATKLAKKAEELIDTTKIEPKEAIGLLREIGTTLRSAMDASASVQAMDKKLLGEPDQVVGHVVQFANVEEMEYEVKMAARAVARLKGEKPIPIDVTPPAPAPTNDLVSRDRNGTAA